MKNTNYSKYGFEFLSIFIAVISAFALNNWNENRKDNIAAHKILTEISNGLVKDIEDVRVNIKGHEVGLAACIFWRNVIVEKEVNLDTLYGYYINLTRDFISEQNISGYESLKSKGLELIEDDSLRYQIITLYEYDYKILKKLEEEYYEMQYHENYFDEINNKVAPNFNYNEKGKLIGLNLPLKINTAEKNVLLSYLLRMEFNRNFILRYYSQMEEKLIKLQKRIEQHLEIPEAKQKVVQDTFSFDFKSEDTTNTEVKSQLKQKLERLAALNDNYQIKKLGETTLEESIVLNGIKKLPKYRAERELFDLKNIDQFEKNIVQINYADIKGTKDRGSKLFARAKVEELIFKTNEMANKLVELVKQLKAKRLNWEAIDKAPNSIFSEGNKVYYISTGGTYMLGLNEEMKNKMKSTSSNSK